MNKTDNVINQLAIELANKAVNGAYDKAERDEALAELQQVKNERDEVLAELQQVKNERDEVLAELQQVKNERDEVLASLENIKLGFEGMNKILQSEERLKNLYEEVKAKQNEKG